MAGCGACSDSCNCTVIGGENTVVTGTGSGTDPYVVTTSSPSWNGASPGGSIDITNLAPDAGHSPELDVRLADGGGLQLGGDGVQIQVDPGSTAPVSLGANGLRVDCCDGGSGLAPDDTDSIDMDITGGLVSGSVITDPDRGLSTEPAGVGIRLEDDPAAVIPNADNLARFTTLGDLSVPTSVVGPAIVSYATDNSGVNVATVTSGAQVNLPVTALDVSANSISTTYSNTGTRSLVLVVEGHGEIIAQSSGGNVQRVFQFSAILESTALTGGATVIGGAGLFTASVLANSAGVIATSFSERHRGLLRLVVLMPAGSSVTWRSRAQALETLSGYTSTVANGSWYQFNNIRRYVLPVKTGSAWSLV